MTTGKSTGKPAEPDMDPGSYPVSVVEGIAQAVIRAALPADRAAMWQAYLAGLELAAELSPDVMPWETTQPVTRMPALLARDTLKAVLTAVRDRGEQSRLAKIGQGAAEKAERRLENSPDCEAPGKLPLQHCAACGKPYRPQRPHSTYCGPNCRAAAYRARRASRQGAPVAR